MKKEEIVYVSIEDIKNIEVDTKIVKKRSSKTCYGIELDMLEEFLVVARKIAPDKINEELLAERAKEIIHTWKEKDFICTCE